MRNFLIFHLCLIVEIFVIVFSNTSFAIQVNSTGCAVSKNCFLPKKIADSFFAWKLTKINGVDYMEMEMKAPMKDTKGYLAVGFSSDTKMGNAGTISCFIESATSQVKFSVGSNPANQRTNTPISASQLDANFLLSSTAGQFGGSFDAANKALQCRFARLVKPTKLADTVKDLASAKFHLLVALGNSVGGAPDNELTYHHTTAATDSAVDFTSSSIEPNIGSRPITAQIILTRVHGSLMCIAWMLFGSVGMMTARHFKNVWQPGKPGNPQPWFEVHRSLLILATSFNALGFILILIKVQGWSVLPTQLANSHPIIGLVITVLSVVNPIMSAFRPSPTASNRVMFNWAHFLVGMIAFVLAGFTICVGAQIYNPTQLQMRSVMITFGVVHFLVDFVLEVHTLVKTKQFNEHLSRVNAMNKENVQEDAPEKPEKSAFLFRTILLALYGVFSLACVIAMIVMIAS